MKEDRATVLLKAVVEILDKCDKSYYVKDVFQETVFYDEADCDGYCLLEDIKSYLEDGE